MEMVQTKIAAAIALILLVSCSQDKAGYSYRWQKFSMDAHRTGVKPASNDRMAETLGYIQDSTYIAPNGKEFTGTTFKVARDVLAVQDRMAPLRIPVGYSNKGMKLDKPESALSDWIVDSYIKIVEKRTGMHIDLSLANFGGIRCDIPAGEVVVNDITSMFPFKNHFCVVQLSGSSIMEIFSQIAASGKVQPAGGIRLEFENGQLVKAEIDGKPILPNKIYNMATIDFLLNGGDYIYAAKDAKKVINTGYLVRDGFLDYLSELQSEGQSIDYQTDGRMIIR